MSPPRRPRPGDEKFADGSGAATDPSRIRSTAVGLLARREHSTAELKDKLLQRGFEPDATETVLAGLAAKGLVSDRRYVASFITHHAARGQGPVRIRADLKGAGVASELVDDALDAAEVDWAEAARTVLRKKFRAPPAGFVERAKQARFLQYRGFSSDQIRAALGGRAADTDADFAADPGPDDS